MSAYGLCYPSEQFKIELRYLSHSLRQTNKNIISFIENNCLELEESKSYFESEFKILLYPSEENHTKYRIIAGCVDETTIDLTDPDEYLKFTGWVCNEKQHRNYMNEFMFGWDIGGILFMDELEYGPWIQYQNDGISMELSMFDPDMGLYLHGIV
jgi:hypothetical protein